MRVQPSADRATPFTFGEPGLPHWLRRCPPSTRSGGGGAPKGRRGPSAKQADRATRTAPSLKKNRCSTVGILRAELQPNQTLPSKIWGKHWRQVGVGQCGHVIGRMKCGSPPLLAHARPAGAAGHRVELLVVDGHGDQQRSPRPRLGSARRQARPARSHRPLVRSRQPLRGLSSLDEGPAHKRRLHRLRRICNRIEANPVRAAHARAAPSEETHELAGVAACSDWLSTCRAYGAGVAPSGSTTAFCCSGQTIGKGGGVVDVQSCQRNS